MTDIIHKDDVDQLKFVLNYVSFPIPFHNIKVDHTKCFI